MGDVFPQSSVDAGLQASALEFLSVGADAGPDMHDHRFSAEPFSAGDNDFGLELQAFAAKSKPVSKAVKGTWLDAYQRENMDDPTREAGYVTAVNSDEAGLYRMFRNLSP